ncbi:MAG: hypothetical protein ACON39_05990 [Coraliomargaritaceae bacterium]
MSAPLRVAIVHYHLKRGGVTRVIESTLRGFNQFSNTSVQIVVLAGEVPEDFPAQDQTSVVEGLHYSNTQEHTPDSSTLLQRMRKAARQALGGDPDIWHIHNHSLGKNQAMPGVVSLLAEAGEALLLQIHDFAEDGRPQNYRINQEQSEYTERLYPLGQRIHYGLINGRDYAIFAGNESKQAQLHFLANPVEVETHSSNPENAKQIRSTLGADQLFLYPVRAVRRKNLGELLFWSTQAKAGTVFATTLGPTNRDYEATYQAWQSLAQRHQLPAHFGIGQSLEYSFADIMQAADCILTTSIAEGFGLSFLEPWLFGKPVAGRDLPEITADFKKQGIQLGPLYQSIPIPAQWIDGDALEKSIRHQLGESYRLYQRKPPENAIERALAAIRPSEDTYEFSGLDEALQSSVVERLANNPQASEELPFHSLEIQNFQNQSESIRKNYGIKAFTQRLETLYQKITSQKVSTIDYLPPGCILDRFLMPERFRLLRT